MAASYQKHAGGKAGGNPILKAADAVSRL